MNDIIRKIEQEQLRGKDLTEFNVGDTIRVYANIKEGTRERIQMFEGVVLKRQNGGNRETFTVRRISYGVGVEKKLGHCIHQTLIISTLLDVVRLEELVFII